MRSSPLSIVRGAAGVNRLLGRARPPSGESGLQSKRVSPAAAPVIRRQGELLSRLRYATPYLYSGATSDFILVSLNANNFAGGSGDYMIWKANWHRERGDESLSLAYADSARISFEQGVNEQPNDPFFHSRLGIATDISVPGLRADPTWSPLRGHPGFGTIARAVRLNLQSHRILCP